MRRIFGQSRVLTRNRAGFTLLESTISAVLAGVLMVSALQALGASRRREISTADRVLGQQLAGSLINEIMLQAYQDPDTVPSAVLGPEPSESNADRVLFDDVDDYAGWKSSPPNDRNGSVTPGFSDWARSVTVQWIDPGTLAVTSAGFTGLKQITVTVSKSGKPITSLVGYRSVAWVDTIPKPTDATGNRAPIAVSNSQYGNFTGMAGSPLSFDASASNDPDGDVLSYVWQFGDGTMASGKVVTHSYATSGFYSCLLTVYDGRGGTSTAARTVSVYPSY